MWPVRPIMTILFGLGWHISVFLTLTSYFRCMFTDPGGVPLELSKGETQEKEKWCNKCDKFKPARTHHCSICRTCVLKMDHHCPWVNNCVGFRNYKFFCLFLMYVTVVALWFVAAAIPYIWASHFRISSPTDLQLLVLFIVCLTFGLALTCFASAHFNYALKNLTTLESFSKGLNPYDLGYRGNWSQVFGNSPVFWFLPVRTSNGDGINYPTLPNNTQNTTTPVEAEVIDVDNDNSLLN